MYLDKAHNLQLVASSKTSLQLNHQHLPNNLKVEVCGLEHNSHLDLDCLRIRHLKTRQVHFLEELLILMQTVNHNNNLAHLVSNLNNRRNYFSSHKTRPFLANLNKYNKNLVKERVVNLVACKQLDKKWSTVINNNSNKFWLVSVDHSKFRKYQFKITTQHLKAYLSLTSELIKILKKSRLKCYIFTT